MDVAASELPISRRFTSQKRSISSRNSPGGVSRLQIVASTLKRRLIRHDRSVLNTFFVAERYVRVCALVNRSVKDRSSEALAVPPYESRSRKGSRSQTCRNYRWSSR